MAPPKHVKSLHYYAVKGVILYMKKICRNLVLKYGSYDSDECQSAINACRDFISINVKGIEMKELCKKWSELDYKGDSRIWAAAFMHIGMNDLSVYHDMESNSPYYSSAFWISQIEYPEHLLYLNLRGVCTDEILLAVKEHCFFLKFINIGPAQETSKEDLYFVTKDLVTDNGLRHLESCKTLEKVDMFSYSTDSMRVTLNAIRQLLKNLPRIKDICFDDMGSIISEEMNDIESLPLTHFRQVDPNLHHIVALSVLCKKVEHLCIKYDNSKQSHEDKSNVIKCITESQLHVRDFELTNLGIDAVFVNFLNVKGEHISRFTLTVNSITPRIVLTLGTHCPNLNDLYLFECVSNEAEITDDLIFDDSKAMFSELVKLTVYGKFWFPEAILPIILSMSENILELTIRTNPGNVSNSADEALNECMRKNPLIKLQKFRGYCFLNFHTISQIAHLPNLTGLCYWEHEHFMKKSDTKKLKKEMKNFDITLVVQQM